MEADLSRGRNLKLVPGLARLPLYHHSKRPELKEQGNGISCAERSHGRLLGSFQGRLHDFQRFRSFCLFQKKLPLNLARLSGVQRARIFLLRICLPARHRSRSFCRQPVAEGNENPPCGGEHVDRLCSFRFAEIMKGGYQFAFHWHPPFLHFFLSGVLWKNGGFLFIA